MREHLPRTSQFLFPGVVVLTRLSSCTDEPAASVLAVHETRWTIGVATDAAAGDAMRATVVTTRAVTVASLRRRMCNETSIRIFDDTAGRTHQPPYVACMQHETIVVVGVTRDRSEIWSLDERQTAPIAVVLRHDEQSDHRHVRTGQHAHGHGSNEGFRGYFRDIAALLQNVNEVMVAGHGTGKASAMEHFAEYLRDHHASVFSKVTELRYVDLPHTTGRELAALGRKWKHEQKLMGRDD